MEIVCRPLGSVPQTCPALPSYPSLFTPAGRQDYDLLVIGGGSGGLACAKEGTCPVSCWRPQAFRAGWGCALRGHEQNALSPQLASGALSLCQHHLSTLVTVPCSHCTPVVYAAHSSQVGTPSLSLPSSAPAPGLAGSPPTHRICLPPSPPSLTALQPPASLLLCRNASLGPFGRVPCPVSCPGNCPA